MHIHLSNEGLRMKISDLSVGQELMIQVSIGGQQLEFPSSVEQTNPKKKLAYLAPAMKDGKILAQGDPEKIITPELIRSVYDVDLTISSADGKPFILPVQEKTVIKKG